jgi:galactose oxidase
MLGRPRGRPRPASLVGLLAMLAVTGSIGGAGVGPVHDATGTWAGVGRHGPHAGFVPAVVPAVLPAPAVLPNVGRTVSSIRLERAGNDPTAGAVSGMAQVVAIDLGDVVSVGGLVYLPPKTGARIGRFTVQVGTGADGWGVPVASGTFADDSAHKTVRFAPVMARLVRLIALTTAGSSRQPAGVEDIQILAGADPPLSRGGWRLRAGPSTEANHGVSAAVDGDTATAWSASHAGIDPPFLEIDLGTDRMVSGLAWLPGTGGGSGRYRIETGRDGAGWVPAVTGVLTGERSAQAPAFPATLARRIRLTILDSDHGSAGRYSVAEVNLLGPPSIAVADQGVWSAPVTFPLVPAAAALLPDGKVLTWSAYQREFFGSGTGQTATSVLDPATATVTDRLVTNTGHDMFCPGISTLPDGRIMVTGGNDSAKTSIYDPATDSWTAGGPLAVPRGYQSSTTLSDGRVFAIGGSWSGGVGGKDGEAWSPTGGWQRLPGAPVAPLLTGDAEGVYHADNHPWLFGWSNRRVFQAGPSRAMNWYGTTGSGDTTPAGVRSDDGDAMNGNAVMFDSGQILTIGGAPSYTNSTATRNAYVISLNGGVTVRKVPSMAYQRAFHNSVVLPDGKVLVVGGQDYAVPFSDNGAVLTPELWDPAAETFTPMAASTIPRTYHSVALLLPDARVLTAGGGLCVGPGPCPNNHRDGQIFTPPYLLNPDGSTAARPGITTAPATAAPGATITVATDRPVAKFSLVRASTVTHAVNTDQRRIPLVPTAVPGGYQLTIPADPGIAVPGRWLLFALDAAGVPSIARTVRVTEAPPFSSSYGDPYADLAILHRLPDNGIDAHLLLGGATPMQNVTTHAGRMPAPIAWDWTKVKPASGDFNADSFQDIALVHQLPDNGADIHVLWGSANPFTNPTTWVRRLPAADGWRWTDFKLASA